MGGGARQVELDGWGFFISIFYCALGFIMPPIGFCIGVYGLLHTGKRLGGFLTLCAAIIGCTYMPYIWLCLLVIGALY